VIALLTGLAGSVALAATPHGSGGVGVTGTTSTTQTSTTPPGSETVEPTPTISVSRDGISLRTTAVGVHGQPLHLSGTVPRGDGGRTVELEQSAGHYSSEVAAESNHDNGFKLSLRAKTVGQEAFTAILGSESTPALKVNIVRSYLATYYGPGFWGRPVACWHDHHRVILRRKTLGVAAHTRFKCGTKVTFYYHGKQITVPVIDYEGNDSRGTWDLTEATAFALGIKETETVGATWR
jgi:hypothetical protein